jgi:hypothetical protein
VYLDVQNSYALWEYDYGSPMQVGSSPQIKDSRGRSSHLCRLSRIAFHPLFYDNLLVNLEAKQIPLTIAVNQFHRLFAIAIRSKQKRHFGPVPLRADLGAAA